MHGAAGVAEGPAPRVGVDDEEWDRLNVEPEDIAGSVDDPVSIYLREIGRVDLLTGPGRTGAGAGEGTGQPPAGTGNGTEPGIGGRSRLTTSPVSGDGESAAWEAAVLLLARIASGAAVARAVGRITWDWTLR